MTPQEINSLANAIAAKGLYGPLYLVIGALISAAIGYLGAYLREKGKNAATKEDISGLTGAVKAVEHRFAAELEAIRGTHALRAAAIEKRLATHQDAYALWIEIMNNVHEETIGAVGMKCQKWWIQNCLYLSPEAREAFRRSYSAALQHRQYLRAGIAPEKIEENWEKIMHVGVAIVEGVDLPPLGEQEFIRTMRKTPNKQIQGAVDPLRGPLDPDL